ncbi:lim and transglutaminase domain protein ltd-1-like isoform X2 [Mya arenaria]|uniref:lim and transglutaminase domain protein ltd-1-like isoform X2 n=1 Tax=Mya arenaria TaxID=6604 RepID=UPI0022E8E1B5|nr:lim and transglutaminase domain protein ltd-1-like isoform X2 [Mya arenaria]
MFCCGGKSLISVIPRAGNTNESRVLNERSPLSMDTNETRSRSNVTELGNRTMHDKQDNVETIEVNVLSTDNSESSLTKSDTTMSNSDKTISDLEKSEGEIIEAETPKEPVESRSKVSEEKCEKDNAVENVAKVITNYSAKEKNMATSPGRLLATYPLVPSFTYSEKLDCYVDNIDLLDPDIPGPHPPTTRKTEVFRLEDYSDVDERAVSAPARLLKGTLKELVAYLTKDYHDDMSRLRVIYRWITCQPLEMITMRKEPPQSHAIFQLWRIRNKKGNYAQLVSLLCRYANIPCVIIHGVLKGSTYEVGDVIDEDRHYGEWNAVLVNGSWRFINAYWGTCAEGASSGNDVIDDFSDESPNKLYYACDENYFLTDPDHVVATHLPKKPKWQLKKNPLSLEEFQKMTFVKDRYFNLKLKTLTHPHCVVESNTGEVEIKFLIPPKKSLDIDFQHLLFKVTDELDKRIDRLAFIHRTNSNDHLTIRVRSPSAGTYRFELVGKDTSVTSESYDYDWIAIYKIVFHEGQYGCPLFPPTPSTGWGPGRVAEATGLVPLSHFTGEVEMDDHGKVEIRFGAAHKDRIGEMLYIAKVYTGGEKMDELPDCAVHRVEDGDVIVNVMTPKKGEFVLRLFAKDINTEKVSEFCNYLLISNQMESNGHFPKGFQTKLGPKAAFMTSGLTPTTPSGLIRSEHAEVYLGFTRTEDIELSVNFSGENVKPAEAPRLLSQTESGKNVTYTVRLPEIGLYGVKIRGTRQDGAVHEPIYDYVIDYRKAKKRTKNTQSIKEEAETYTHDTYADILRRRLRMSIEESNPIELKNVISEMRGLKIASMEQDIMHGEEECIFINIKRDLLIAIRDKDSKKLKSAVKKVKAAKLEERLQYEVNLAKSLIERLKKLQKLLHAILALDQSTIMEIRGYSSPPPIVHTVMMATLLLLGHWHEDTKAWKNIQTLLLKTGKESIKRHIQDFRLECCPLEAAMGAKDYLRDYSIDQVRLVSAGCATFYVWVKGVIEELEKRAGEEMSQIRPKTGKGRRRRELTFLNDLNGSRDA